MGSDLGSAPRPLGSPVRPSKHRGNGLSPASFVLSKLSTGADKTTGWCGGLRGCRRDRNTNKEADCWGEAWGSQAIRAAGQEQAPWAPAAPRRRRGPLPPGCRAGPQEAGLRRAAAGEDVQLCQLPEGTRGGSSGARGVTERQKLKRMMKTWSHLQLERRLVGWEKGTPRRNSGHSHLGNGALCRHEDASVSREGCWPSFPTIWSQNQMECECRTNNNNFY